VLPMLPKLSVGIKEEDCEDILAFNAHILDIADAGETIIFSRDKTSFQKVTFPHLTAQDPKAAIYKTRVLVNTHAQEGSSRPEGYTLNMFLIRIPQLTVDILVYVIVQQMDSTEPYLEDMLAMIRSSFKVVDWGLFTPE